MTKTASLAISSYDSLQPNCFESRCWRGWEACSSNVRPHANQFIQVHLLCAVSNGLDCDLALFCVRSNGVAKLLHNLCFSDLFPLVWASEQLEARHKYNAHALARVVSIGWQLYLTSKFAAGTVVTVPTPENVLAAVKLPEATIATMQDMTVFEVSSVFITLDFEHCYKHLPFIGVINGKLMESAGAGDVWETPCSHFPSQWWSTKLAVYLLIIQI